MLCVCYCKLLKGKSVPSVTVSTPASKPMLTPTTQPLPTTRSLVQLLNVLQRLLAFPDRHLVKHLFTLWPPWSTSQVLVACKIHGFITTFQEVRRIITRSWGMGQKREKASPNNPGNFFFSLKLLWGKKWVKTKRRFFYALWEEAAPKLCSLELRKKHCLIPGCLWLPLPKGIAWEIAAECGWAGAAGTVFVLIVAGGMDDGHAALSITKAFSTEENSWLRRNVTRFVLHGYRNLCTF